MARGAVSLEEQMQAWRQTEKAACDAEGEVARLGQGASDPRARDLSRNAALFVVLPNRSNPPRASVICFIHRFLC